MQSYVVQYKARQTSAMQSNEAKQHNATQCKAMQSMAMQSNASKCKAVQSMATLRNVTRCDAMQCKANQSAQDKAMTAMPIRAKQRKVMRSSAN
eukprot:6031614-Pyramimonas_sp.AAC.1